MNSSYNFYTDSGQILSPDEFYEKMMTKISQLGTLKNRGEQCRDSELQYEMKQAKCGNKGEFCSSLCSDKLKSKKTVNQDKWDGSSEHKSRGLQGKLDAPCNKSYKTVHEGKSMVKSLPISVGALQGEQKLRISTNEEVRNANQADPSEASLKAGEDRLCSHLDESAIYLAKFEDKLVRRSQNRIRFEQVPDADMLRTEFSEINPEELPEERLSNLIDERGMFHAKFQEALKQGNSVRLKLQEILELERSRHKSSKEELKQMKRNFKLFWSTSFGCLPESKDTNLGETLSSTSLQEEELLVLQRSNLKSSKKEIESTKDFELFSGSRLGPLHELKGTSLGQVLSNEFVAREHERDKQVFERKKEKEKYECLLIERANLDLEFEAKHKCLDAHRIKLQGLFDPEAPKLGASQVEFQEQEPYLGKFLLKEETGEVREYNNLYKGNMGPTIESLAGEKIYSTRCCEEGKENCLTEDMVFFSMPLGSLKDVPVDKIESIQNSKTGDKIMIKKAINCQESLGKTTEYSAVNCELEDSTERIRNSSETIQKNIEEGDWEREILRCYTSIYQSPVFEDFRGAEVGSRKSITKSQQQTALNLGNYDSAKQSDHKDIKALKIKEGMEKLTDPSLSAREKMGSESQEQHDKAYRDFSRSMENLVGQQQVLRQILV